MYTEGNSCYKGWHEINGKWYYFYSSGYMAKDTMIDKYEIGYDGVALINQQGTWKKINGSWYFYDSNGNKKTGFIVYNNNKYYLDNSGKMRTGWLKMTNGDWYYADLSSGVLYRNEVKTIDGKKYNFNCHGVWGASGSSKVIKVDERGNIYYVD